MTAKAVVALIPGSAVFEVLGDDAPLVQEGALRLSEADPVLLLVEAVLAGVPLKGKRQRTGMLTPVWLWSHTTVWHGTTTNSAANDQHQRASTDEDLGRARVPPTAEHFMSHAALHALVGRQR